MNSNIIFKKHYQNFKLTLNEIKRFDKSKLKTKRFIKYISQTVDVDKETKKSFLINE